MEGDFPDDDDFEAELARELALLGEITPDEIAAAQAGLGHAPYLGPRFDDHVPDAPDGFPGKLGEPAERGDPRAAMDALAAALRGDADGEGNSWEDPAGGAWSAYVGRGREKDEALEAMTLSVAEGRSAAAAVLIPARSEAGALMLMVEGIEGYDVHAAGDGDVGERKAALYLSRAERALQQKEEDDALRSRREVAAAEREETRRKHEEATAALQAEQVCV